ncbi:MAG: hypothetical protein ACREUZ_07365 [Burkholderiales bacterium]
MRLRALVAYDSGSAHVATTRDYLKAIKQYSGFDVRYVHATCGAIMDFDVNEFDVVFHNYCGRLCIADYVSHSYRNALKRFRGLKILSVQDEYDHTDLLKAAIKDLGFQIVLTCVPQESLSYVYPSHEFPGVTFETVLTGYVPEHLAETPRPLIPLADRPIVVGYRGRDIGARYGRLAFEKFEIGRRMKEICLSRGVPHDIAFDEESRIYGDGWFDFIGSCRAMLGTESGSNVFDFDRSIRVKFDALSEEHGGRVGYDQFLPVVAQRDSEIEMGQVSPRAFECAVMRTPMVLFRARYSDILEPDEHYIPLKKDFSNIDEVLRRLNDLDALERLAERSYAHLVGSGLFGYKAFWARLADLINRERAKRALDQSVAVSQSESQPSGVAIEDTLSHVMLAQQPTDIPVGAKEGELMVAVANFFMLCKEEHSFAASCADHIASCMAAIRSLSETYRQGFDRIAAVAGPAPALPPDIPSEEVLRLKAAYEADSVRWEREIQAVKTQISTDGRKESEAVVHSTVALLEARLASIISQMKAFNAQYDWLVRYSPVLIHKAESLRIANVYKDHTGTCLAEARRLADVYATERARVPAEQASGLPAALLLDDLLLLTSVFDREAESFECEWSKISDVDECVRIAQTRVRSISDQLGAFNVRYESFIEVANRLILEVVGRQSWLQHLQQGLNLNATSPARTSPLRRIKARVQAFLGSRYSSRS